MSAPVWLQREALPRDFYQCAKGCRHSRHSNFMEGDEEGEVLFSSPALHYTVTASNVVDARAVSVAVSSHLILVSDGVLTTRLLGLAVVAISPISPAAALVVPSERIPPSLLLFDTEEWCSEFVSAIAHALHGLQHPDSLRVWCTVASLQRPLDVISVSACARQRHWLRERDGVKIERIEGVGKEAVDALQAAGFADGILLSAVHSHTFAERGGWVGVTREALVLGGGAMQPRVYYHQRELAKEVVGETVQITYRGDVVNITGTAVVVEVVWDALQRAHAESLWHGDLAGDTAESFGWLRLVLSARLGRLVTALRPTSARPLVVACTGEGHMPQLLAEVLAREVREKGSQGWLRSPSMATAVVEAFAGAALHDWCEGTFGSIVKDIPTSPVWDFPVLLDWTAALLRQFGASVRSGGVPVEVRAVLAALRHAAALMHQPPFTSLAGYLVCGGICKYLTQNANAIAVGGVLYDMAEGVRGVQKAEVREFAEKWKGDLDALLMLAAKADLLPPGSVETAFPFHGMKLTPLKKHAALDLAVPPSPHLAPLLRAIERDAVPMLFGGWEIEEDLCNTIVGMEKSLAAARRLVV